jgi:myo-inositol 2-dehydrogenase / D-chiro-inositol 1-dehydrogenase
MSVGFGLLGSGFMAHTYAESLAKHVPNAHLAAVALGSRAPGLVEEYDVALEPTAEALLARDDVQAVIIATPHSTHVSLAIEAAAAGRHVYLEKPMAVTLAECDRMIEACRAAGVLLTVNHVTRYRRSPRTAKGLVDEGAIGDLRMVRVLSSVIGYLPDDHGWAKNPEEGGAWLDMGVHMFDALRWFTDSEVDVIFASIRDFGGLEHQRRTGLAETVMRNGVLTQLLVSMEMPAPGLGSQSQWTLVGSDGIIESDSYGKVRLGRGDTWELVYEMPPFALNADVYSPVRLEAFAAQVEGFAAAIEAGGAAGMAGEDGRAAVELVEAAARSSSSGQAVRLPLGPA